MNANDLLKAIVHRLAHPSEGEKEALLAAVDVAFPAVAPEADAVMAAVDEAEKKEPAGDPVGTAPMFKAPSP